MKSAKKSGGKTKSAPKNKGGQSVSRASLTTGNGKHEKSIDVRKIDNGFIVRESQMSKGKNPTWKEREVFHPTNPVNITVPSGAKSMRFGSKKS